MNTQAFIHTTEPEPNEVEPIQNSGGDRGGIHVKPLGGIWTSTLEDGTCGWHQWCHSEQWGLTEESALWALEPDDDVNVYVIDGEDDLLALLDRFERDDSPLARDRYPDYEAIARETEYDGIRLTEEGQWATRMSRPGLYGWDCESTVWFDWHFSDANHVKHIGKDYREEDWQTA